MIFVDTNVLMYAVGGDHPLKPKARAFFTEALEKSFYLVTSAEVLQELLHAYVPVQRFGTLDAALDLADAIIQAVWPVEGDDVRFARELAGTHEGLGARDLLHLAVCRRRGVQKIKTFDRALAAALKR